MPKHRFPSVPHRPLLAAVTAAALMATACAVSAAAHQSVQSLQNRLSQTQSRESSLQQGIGSDNSAIGSYQSRIGDLQTHLNALDQSLAIEQSALTRLQDQLRSARAQMIVLQSQLQSDRAALAAQLVAQYESAPPDATTVLLSSHGFADLLERVDQLRLIAQRNAFTVTAVKVQKAAVTTQAQRLATLEARQYHVTHAVLIQHDEVDQLRLTLLSEQARYIQARDAKSATLHSLRRHEAAIQNQLASAQAAENAQNGFGGAPSLPAGAGYSGGGFSPHGGDYGFFPAPGTNYSVGEEPALAARLDALGKALGLHLIGISGYRTPQHSVEVGGFADDPHTRGQASDTPGIEGVPEATLERFGLTRPFGGAAEADHIQLH